MTLAGFIRALMVVAVRNYHIERAATAADRGQALTGEDLLKLDQACREMGVDLAVALRD